MPVSRGAHARVAQRFLKEKDQVVTTMSLNTNDHARGGAVRSSDEKAVASEPDYLIVAAQRHKLYVTLCYGRPWLGFHWRLTSDCENL